MITECYEYYEYLLLKTNMYDYYFQASAVDKKSVMTFVICLYQVLPHEDTVIEADSGVANKSHPLTPVHQLTAAAVSSPVGRNSTPTTASSSATASPLKVPPKVVTKGRINNLF